MFKLVDTQAKEIAHGGLLFVNGAGQVDIEYVVEFLPPSEGAQYQVLQKISVSGGECTAVCIEQMIGISAIFYAT